MFFRMGSGEAALRVMRRRARRHGDSGMAEKLDQLLADREMAAVSGVAIEDETGGSLFRDILQWIVENPDQFFAILERLIALFSGASVGSPATPATEVS